MISRARLMQSDEPFSLSGGGESYSFLDLTPGSPGTFRGISSKPLDIPSGEFNCELTTRMRNGKNGLMVTIVALKVLPANSKIEAPGA